MANAVFSVFNNPLFAIDRIRYYWPRPELTETVRALREGFSGRTLRRPVLLQFFDEAIIDRADDLVGVPDYVNALVHASIQAALAPSTGTMWPTRC